jgi:translocation and assembly module TamB
MLGRTRKPLLVAAASFGAVLVVAIAGIALALLTTVGARWSLGAVDQIVPGEIAVGRVDGSVARGLVLTNVSYESPELTATVARLAVDARLGALLDGRVVLSRLAAERGTVTLRESSAAAAEPPGEPPALPVIPGWLAVQSLQIRDVAFAAGVDTVIAELVASVTGPQIEIEALEAQVAGGRIEARGDARLGADAAARIDGSWTMPASPGQDAAGAGDTRVELAAEVELVTGAMPWRATLVWDRLAVQTSGARWSSPTGRLTLTPGTMPIGAELTAELTGSALPAAATVSGSASLSGNMLEIEALDIETLGGRIVAHGVADLGALAGHAAVEYSMLDASFIDPRIEGRLRGSLVAAFAAQRDVVAGAAGTLGGTLSGRPLDGTLRARLQGGVVHLDAARVALEHSVVELAGRISPDSVDFTFDATLPELASWYPPAAGSVRASGSLSGSASDPALDAELMAEHVAVESLPPLDSLSLDVSGTLSAHEARLRASSADGGLSLRVEQGWSGERLAGTVLESRLAVDRAGTWTLSAPAKYGLAGTNANLERLCYEGPQQARLCAAVAEDTLRVDADDVPSALAEPWLGADVRLDGAADLSLTLGWRPALHGSFTLTQPVLRVAPPAAPGADEPSADEASLAELASIDDIRVTGTLTEEALDARLTAALTASGDPLEAQLTLVPPTAQGMLDATLTARLTSLELIDAFAEDLEQLTGSLAVSLRATGSLAAPELAGELSVDSLGAVVPPLGIEISSGRLTARPRGLGALEFDAELCSTGCVELRGSFALDADAAPWRVTAELTGDSFELADLPDLRAVIAPTLSLDATPAAWQVTGNIAIDDGSIAVDSVPRSAVRPAPETVVHGRPAASLPEELPVPLVFNVDVTLGDVRFEGLGIAAELGGLLSIEQTQAGQLLVNGTASIEEGTFSAYSQELTIERGDLLFTGPSDNPALDVRATREVEGATVGLTLTGTLRDPQSEIFSMPALTESEALARLVTGRSLESAGTADAQAIERAALGLGIRRALPALERIGANLGLDELGVDSGGSGDNSALVAGRQLGDDVYLRYKQGLFDDFAGLELIYRITERFRLRTETGTAQSIDLLYERNRTEDRPLAETESGFEDAEPKASTD